MTTETAVATPSKPKRIRRDQFCVHCATENMTTCEQCGHETKCPSCGLCNIHKEIRTTPRKPPTREFHISCEFIPKSGSYSFRGETVIKAFSMYGAIRQGVYALKKEKVPARKQLKGVVIKLVPMPGKKGQ